MQNKSVLPYLFTKKLAVLRQCDQNTRLEP